MTKINNIVRFKQFFYQFFMWICIFNLTYFVACSIIFFKLGTITNTISLAIFSTKAIFFIYMIVKFICQLYNFKYFWNSF